MNLTPSSPPTIDSNGPQPGFGLLRFDAHSPLHLEALKSAWGAGVRIYDFGYEGWDEKSKALEEAIRSHPSQTGLPRVFLRIELDPKSDRKNRSDHLERLPSNGTLWTVLLSDPEFRLSSLGDDHERLYSAIGQELESLEALAQNQKISDYGIGSAAFTYPKEDSQYLSIEELLFKKKPGELRDTRSDLRLPHFRWIELPYNLYESAAFLFANQNLGEESVTPLEIAKAHDLCIATRRPYDAITENGLVRLANYPDHHRVDLDAAVQRTLEVALQAEVELSQTLSPEQPADSLPSGLVPWAHRLRDQLRFVRDPEQWKEIRRRKISPDLARLSESAPPAIPEGNTTPVLKKYFDSMDALLLSVQLWCEKRAAERNERVRARITSAVPSLRLRLLPTEAKLERTETRLGRPPTLQDIALRAYRSTPGVSAILIGMRSPRYVSEALSAFSPSIPKLSVQELEGLLYAAHEALHEEELQ